MAIQTVNPATGEPIQEYQEMTTVELDNIIVLSNEVYKKWRELDISERSQCFQRLISQFDQDKENLATLMANEMGKPVSAGRKEVEKCQRLCRYYIDNAEEFLAPRSIQTEMQKSYIAYKPIGIIFAIMPWNFPVWQVMRFAVPNIMVGNTAILSHAPICTGTSIAIEQLFLNAGFPEGMFRSVVVDNDAAKYIIEHPLVRGVTLTGSERAGKAVGAEAAGALKKVVLELGGSDPYVILEDADLEKAAEAIVTSRMSNTGQVCISAKRIIVLDQVHDNLVTLVSEKVKRFDMGDPLNDDTNYGPMAREDLRAEVHKQVQKSIEKGATCLAGGKLPEGRGFYYPPTILTSVEKGMPAMDEEIFGPVISFIRVTSEDEAVEVANDTQYGLAGAVFTENLERGERLAADKIKAGTVYVNDFVASDPRLPFGGIKNSGYGRELAEIGMHEFVNVKTICVK